MYLIIVGCLVVNIIFYLLLACSTSFYEAFLFGLSFIVKINLDRNPNFLLCNIHLCDICFKLFASSEAFSLSLSLSPYCCGHGCDLTRVLFGPSSVASEHTSISGIIAYLC